MAGRLAVLALFLLAVATPSGPFALAWQLAPDSLRDLLHLHGIDASQLDRFQNGEPIGGNDEEPLARILQRFPRFPRQRLERWSQQEKPDWQLISAEPAQFQSHVFRVRGRVIRIETTSLLPEAARRLEFSEYHRVTVQLAPAPGLAVVCVRHIPHAWLKMKSLDEPAEFIGIFLKTGPRRGDDTELLFAAERVGWYPAQVNTAAGVSASQLFLARSGFDIGLLDDARAENKKPLSVRDRECFYQLLGAIGRTSRETMIAQPHQPIDLVKLLREPRGQQGQLVTLDGIARRAVKIRIEDPDVRARFGMDHYYQIDLFVNLNQQVIRLQSAESGDQAPIFENSYPLTVCVPSLPPDLPEGEVLRENVRVHGVFFKLWAFSSDYVSSFDKRMMQISPMLIGVEPRRIPMEVFNPRLGIGLALLTLLSLLGMAWGLLRRAPRSVVRLDRLSRATAPNQAPAAGEETSLPDRPDFSNLG